MRASLYPLPLPLTRAILGLALAMLLASLLAATLAERCETVRLLRQRAARISVALALIQLPASGVVRALLGRLHDCGDHESCGQAVGARPGRSNPRAAAAVVARREDSVLQTDRIRALGQAAGPEAVASLVDCLLHHESSRARIEAARALRLIGGPLVKYSLCHVALDDPEPAVRQAAYQAWMDLSSRGGNASP